MELGMSYNNPGMMSGYNGLVTAANFINGLMN
jgi:hypothetical protein